MVSFSISSATAASKAFLPLIDGGELLLYAVTHHVYPSLGRNGTRAFNSPQALDRTKAEIEWYTRS